MPSRPLQTACVQRSPHQVERNQISDEIIILLTDSDRSAPRRETSTEDKCDKSIFFAQQKKTERKKNSAPDSHKALSISMSVSPRD